MAAGDFDVKVDAGDDDVFDAVAFVRVFGADEVRAVFAASGADAEGRVVFAEDGGDGAVSNGDAGTL